MKIMKIFLVYCFFFSAINSLNAQQLYGAAYILENDLGRSTIVYAQNEEETRLFFGRFMYFFEESGTIIYPSDEPLENTRELIEEFVRLNNRYINNWDYNPESFTIIMDLEDDLFTDYWIHILEIKGDNEFTYIYTSLDLKDEVLLLMD